MNNRPIPMYEAIAFALSGIFFLVIPSIAKTKSCHPSRPGNGSKLTIPKLIDIKPQ